MTGKQTGDAYVGDFVHLLTGDWQFATCNELTLMARTWRELVAQGDFAGALGLVEASVRVLCGRLTRVVAEREAEDLRTALQRKERDERLRALQKNE